MSVSHFSIHPVCTNVGAEIHGLNLAVSLEPQTVLDIRKSLLEHGELFSATKMLILKDFCT